MIIVHCTYVKRLCLRGAEKDTSIYACSQTCGLSDPCHIVVERRKSLTTTCMRHCSGALVETLVVPGATRESTAVESIWWVYKDGSFWGRPTRRRLFFMHVLSSVCPSVSTCLLAMSVCSSLQIGTPPHIHMCVPFVCFSFLPQLHPHAEEEPEDTPQGPRHVLGLHLASPGDYPPGTYAHLSRSLIRMCVHHVHACALTLISKPRVAPHPAA